MLFVIKKIIACFLMPMPVIALILLCALFFLWFTKKQKTGKIIMSCGVFLFIILGFESFSNLLISPLEQIYSKCKKTDFPVKYIAVLGGGSDYNSQIPASSQLSGSSLNRLIEGIIIYRENPGSILILSGFGGKDKKSNAEVMADVAVSLGVPESDIIEEPLPRDTREEALCVKEIVGDQPFALVTSAVHMKRAMMAFKAQKTNPIPFPTDYLVKKKNSIGIELPSSGGFVRAESACHEYIGILWEKIKRIF